MGGEGRVGDGTGSHACFYSNLGMSPSTLARARHGVPVHCPAGTQSRSRDILHVTGSSMTSLRRREAVAKKSVRYITRISCFVTVIILPNALQIYSTDFVKKCMRLHFSR